MTLNQKKDDGRYRGRYNEQHSKNVFHEGIGNQ